MADATGGTRIKIYENCSVGGYPISEEEAARLYPEEQGKLVAEFNELGRFQALIQFARAHSCTTAHHPRPARAN